MVTTLFARAASSIASYDAEVPYFVCIPVFEVYSSF